MQRPSQAACRFYTAFYRWNILTLTSSTHHLGSHQLSCLRRRASWKASRYLSTTHRHREQLSSRKGVPSRSTFNHGQNQSQQNRRESWKNWLHESEPQPSSKRPFDTLNVWEDVVRHRSSAGLIVQTCVPAITIRDLERVYGRGLKDIGDKLFDGHTVSLSVEVGSDIVEKEVLAGGTMKVRSVLYSGTFEEVEKVRLKLGSVSGQQDDDESAIGHEARGGRRSGLVRGFVADDNPLHRERREQREVRQDGPVRRVKGRGQAKEMQRMHRSNESLPSEKRDLDYDVAIQQSRPTPPPVSEPNNLDSDVSNSPLGRTTSFSSVPTRSIAAFGFKFHSLNPETNHMHFSTVIPSTTFSATGLWHNYVTEPNRRSIGANITLSDEFIRVDNETGERGRYREVEVQGSLEQVRRIQGAVIGIRRSLRGGESSGVRLDEDDITAEGGAVLENGRAAKDVLQASFSSKTDRAPVGTRLMPVKDSYTPLPSWLLTPPRSRTELPSLGLAPLQPILRDRSQDSQTLSVEIVIPANEKWDQEVMQLLQQPRDVGVSIDLESPLSRVDENTGESHWRRPLMLKGNAQETLIIVDAIEGMRRRVLGLVQSKAAIAASSDRVVDVPTKHVRRAARRDEVVNGGQATMNTRDGAFDSMSSASIDDTRATDTAAARTTSPESRFAFFNRLAIPAVTANSVFVLLPKIQKNVEHVTGPRTCVIVGEENPEVDRGERFLRVWAENPSALGQARRFVAKAIRRVARKHGIEGVSAGNEFRRVNEEGRDLSVTRSGGSEDVLVRVEPARQVLANEDFRFSVRLAVPAEYADCFHRLVPDLKKVLGSNNVSIIAERDHSDNGEQRFLRVSGKRRYLLRVARLRINRALRRVAAENGAGDVAGIRARVVDDAGREINPNVVGTGSRIAAVNGNAEVIEGEEDDEPIDAARSAPATILDPTDEATQAADVNLETASGGVTTSLNEPAEDKAIQSGVMESKPATPNDGTDAEIVAASKYTPRVANEPNANVNLASVFDEAVRVSTTTSDAEDSAMNDEMKSDLDNAGRALEDPHMDSKALPLSGHSAASGADDPHVFHNEITIITRHADYVISKMTSLKADIARSSPEDEWTITSGPSSAASEETVFEVSASSEETLRHVRSRIASYARASFVKEGAKPGHIEIRPRDGQRWVVEDASATVTELEVRASSILPIYCRFATPLQLVGHVLKRGTKVRDIVHYSTSKVGKPVQANHGSGNQEQHFLLWASGSSDIRDGKEYLRKLTSRLVAEHYPKIDAKSAIRFIEQGIDEDGHARGQYAYFSSLPKGREPPFSSFCAYSTFTLPQITLEDINTRFLPILRSTRCQLQRLAPQEISVGNLPEDQGRRLYTLWGKSEELVKRAKDRVEKTAKESLQAQGEEDAALSVVQEGVSDVTLGKLMEDAAGLETKQTEKMALDGTAVSSGIHSARTDPLSAASETDTYFEGAEDSEPNVEDGMIFPEFNPPFADDFAMKRPPESRSLSLNLPSVAPSVRAVKRPLQQRAYSTYRPPLVEPRATQVTSEHSAGAANEVQEDAASKTTKDDQLIDDIKHTLRTVTHPVVVVTSRFPLPRTLTKKIDDRLDLCRGVTVSSFNTVTLTPTPIVSLNLRVPSRTWDAMCKSKQFSIHVVSATPEGAVIAHAFTQPYDQPSEPFRRLEQLGVYIWVETRNTTRRVQAPRFAWSNAVMARIDALLMPQSCVNIGDHVIVVAKAIRVHFPSKGKGYSDRVVDEEVALAYAKQGYRTVGDGVTPIDLPELHEHELPREPRAEHRTEADAIDSAHARRDADGENELRTSFIEDYSERTGPDEKPNDSVPRFPKAATWQTLNYSNPPPVPQSGPKCGGQNTWGISRNAKSSYSTLAVPANCWVSALRQYSTTSTDPSLDAEGRSRRSPMDQVSNPEILSSTVANFLGVPEQDGEGVPKYRIRGLMRLQKEARVASRRLERALADGSLTPEESSRLENIVTRNERRIAKVLALRSAKDLHRILNKGRVDYNQVQWLETNIEKGQAVLLEEARQLRRLLNERTISEEQFQIVKEKLALQNQTLSAEAIRLRQMVDEDSEGGGAIDKDFDGFRGNV